MCGSKAGWLRAFQTPSSARGFTTPNQEAENLRVLGKTFHTPPVGEANIKLYNERVAEEQAAKKKPTQRSSPPSGGPTRLGIRRSASTRKRSGVSGRSRSKRKAFSRS